MDKRADIKPVSFIGKSEIAQRPDTLEARAEASKVFNAQAEEATKAMEASLYKGELIP